MRYSRLVRLGEGLNVGGIVGSIHGKGKRFSLFRRVRDHFSASPFSLMMSTDNFFLDGKASGL
jgi:hypothetical protein